MEICRKMDEGKKINIYGTGVNAMKFILTNRNIKVASIIEGKRNVAYFMKGIIGEIPVIRIEDAEDVLRKHYTIVASSENIYWDIKKKLELEYQLIEFENFEYWETFCKKVVIIYGNCHTSAIKAALKTSSIFNQIYGFYPLKPIQEIKSEGGNGFKTRAFQKCSLFIHQCIRQENIYGAEYASSNFLRLLHKNCMVIGIPNLYRLPKFMFPQIPDTNNYIEWESYNYFPFRDKYIDGNYSSIPIEKINDMINDDKLINPTSIIENQEKFFEKVKKRESEWDIKILDFLRNKISDQLLFYDPNHPTNVIIEYIANGILKLLSLDEYIFKTDYLLQLDNYQIPIYKSVRNALKLNYKTEYLRNYSNNRLCNNRMDIKEYIRQYIMWNYAKSYEIIR